MENIEPENSITISLSPELDKSLESLSWVWECSRTEALARVINLGVYASKKIAQGSELQFIENSQT